MLKRIGIIALAVLAGVWIVACVPTRQIVKSDTLMTPATPQVTPVADVLATATPTTVPTVQATSTPASVSAVKHTPKAPQAAQAQSKRLPVDTVQPETVVPRDTDASTQLEANVAPQVFPENPIPSEAAVTHWTPTPITGNYVAENSVEESQQAGQQKAGLSPARLLLGVGLVVLFGGLIFFIRRVREKRGANRSRQVEHADKSVTAKAAEAAASLRNPEHFAEHVSEPKTGVEAAVVGPVSAEPKLPRRRKIAVVTKTAKTSTARKTKKAALRSARPTVKIVRLAKGTTAAKRSKKKVA